MKLKLKYILFLLILFISHVISRAQENLFDIYLKDATLPELVSIIEIKTGYTFMYDNTLSEDWRFTISEQKQTIQSILSKLFVEKKIDYVILGNQIILKKRIQKTDKDSNKIQLSGTVVDDKGEPIIGVTIMEKGKSVCSFTDYLGHFYISVLSDAVLVFTHVAYTRVELPVSKIVGPKVVMTEDQKKMSEVVVLGYGSALKRDLTGSVSSISADLIKNQSMQNDFLKVLQGQVAGADIISDNAPGDGAVIHIRGYNSLNASNSPLIVVDDAPYSGNYKDLNPNEIEKIDILKDASSTAIYGSRGSNGVVIITTKRGSSKGKLEVEYNGYYGVGKSYGDFNMMDGDKFLRYKQISGSPFDAIQNRVIAKKNYTDWQKLMFNGTSQKTDHAVSLSMSNGRSKNSLQLGYYNEQGIIENMSFNRTTARFTGDLDLVSNFKMGYSASLAHSLRKNGDPNVWRNGTLLDPLTEVYDENGNMRFYNSDWNQNALHSNPIFDTKLANVDNETKRDRILGNAYFSWMFIDNLTFKSSLTYDLTAIENGAYYSATSQFRSNASSGAFYRKPTENTTTFTNNLTYHKVGNKQDFRVTVVHDMQSSNANLVGVSGFNLPYNGLWYNVSESQLNQTTQSFASQWAILSFMSRINYSYSGKYLFTVTGRADGSSKLAKGHKWGGFPSAAIAWRMSEESFMKPLKAISNLKWRLGWGISGNTAIDAYSTLGKLGRFPYNFGVTSDNSAIGYVPSEISNPNLGWERTSEVNLGLDFALKNNAISGSIDVYQKNTYDLLMKRNLPTTSGYSDVWQNVGQTQNTGVELTVQTILISSKNFTWTTNLTFNYNKNEIIKLFNGTEDSPSNKWFIGHPVEVDWITKYVGVWQKDEANTAILYNRLPGQSKLLDTNNDKIIDQSDNFIFNRIPKYVGGFSSTMKYKAFDLSFYLYTRLDYGSMMGIITMPDFGTANWNQLDYDFWTPNNPTNGGPQPALTRDSYAQGSTYAYRDLSFVRLKNINIGYNSPLSFVNKLGAKTLRLFVILENPILWTRNDYIGIDPENCNSPIDARPLKSVAIGLNAKF